jgi:hypothetical protein
VANATAGTLATVAAASDAASSGKGESTAATTSVNNYELPPAKSACKYVDPANAAELITLLHQEAKII